MNTITVKEVIIIESTRQHTWDYTQNFDNRKSWDKTILEFKILQKRPYKLIWFKAVGGITAKLKYKFCDKPNKTTLKLIDVKSPIIKGGGGSWNYETVNNKTKWTQVNSIIIKNKCCFLVFGYIVKKWLTLSTKKSMRTAKILIEKNNHKQQRV